MKSPRRTTFFLLAVLGPAAFAPACGPRGGAGRLPYRDPQRPIERRVRDLISRMTVEEKFWQLFMIPGDLSDGKGRYKNGIFGLQISPPSAASGGAGRISDDTPEIAARRAAETINGIQKFFVEETRLGIPIIPFDEALHGLVRPGATSFPQSIALAATWDPELVARAAAAAAVETRSRGIRQVLSPVVNLASDVRWGRVEETYGEDPLLASRLGAAFVRAFESRGVIATPKHFVANVGDGGRDSYPVSASERRLREVEYRPFQACLFDGGARSIMTAYNSLDGVPCTSNPRLLRETLKQAWGFKGFVISDAGAVGGLLDLHHTVRSREESARSAIEGGLDVIFQTDYEHHVPLLAAFTSGLISPAAIDEAVGRVLKAKFELGLFENPYVDPAEAARLNGAASHREAALDAARASLVLLKNEGSALPLKKTIRSLAVIGPDAVEARQGGYGGPGNRKVSILDGLKALVGDTTRVSFAPGCGRSDEPLVAVPAGALTDGQGRPGLRGEYFPNPDFDGAPALVRTDPRIDFRWTLFSPDPAVPADWYSVRWTGRLMAPAAGVKRLGIEGDDGFRLYADGKLVIDDWPKRSYGTRAAGFVLPPGRSCDIRLEFHETTGNARLKLVWDAGSIDGVAGIRDAVSLARRSEAAVLVAGIEEGEFRDRADLRLPGRQEELIRAVAATGTPVVVVLVGGGAVTMESWLDDVPAVLEAWYPGEAGGTAAAEALFGEFSPGGKLPVAFPRSAGQLPLAYDHEPTGRGDDYADLSGRPLFPFGHGLSYASFVYEDLRIDPPRIAPDGRAVVSCRVRNAGGIPADEIVQLYLHDAEASVVRPVMELQGFRRIRLRPGEFRDVAFELGPGELSLLDAELRTVVEPGEFRIMVGSSSRDIRLRGVLTVGR